MASFSRAVTYEIKNSGFAAQSKGWSRPGRRFHTAARVQAA
jgi:hypothetical protein